MKAKTTTTKIDTAVFWTTLSMVIRPTSAPVWVGLPVLQVDGSVVCVPYPWCGAPLPSYTWLPYALVARPLNSSELRKTGLLLCMVSPRRPPRPSL